MLVILLLLLLTMVIRRRPTTTLEMLNNTLMPKQNDWHFAEDIVKVIFLYENDFLLILIELQWVPKCPIDN